LSLLDLSNWIKIVPLILAIGCTANVAPVVVNQSETMEPAGSPVVPDWVIWRPFANTCAGKIDAGTVMATAFVVEGEGLRPSLISSLGLLTTASGLSRDLKPSEMEGCVTIASVSDAFGASDSVKKIGSVVAFPKTDDSVDDGRWNRLGIVAFDPSGLRYEPLKLSKTPIKPGDRIWMITAVYAGAPASQKCHEATVVSINDSGELQYRLPNATLSMEATQGAPLLSDAGDLVGIHQRGSLDAETLTGFGVGGETLYQGIAELIGASKQAP